MNQMTSAASESAENADFLNPIENYCTHFSFSLVCQVTDSQNKIRTRKTVTTTRTMNLNLSFSHTSFFFSLVAPDNLFSGYRGKHVLNASGPSDKNKSGPPRRAMARKKENMRKNEERKMGNHIFFDCRDLESEWIVLPHFIGNVLDY